MSIVILENTLSYLRFNQIWPKKGNELKPGKMYYFQFILMVFSTSIILLGSILHLIMTLRYNSNNNISEDFVMIVAEVGVFYFMSIFVYEQKGIASIYLDLSNFKKFGEPPRFAERNRQLLFFSKVYKTFIDLAIVNFCLYPVLTVKYCEKRNVHLVLKESCGLMALTWMPFDISQFPLKYVFYFWQGLTMLLTMKGAAVISFAIMESMEHLIVRIQHVKDLLEDTINTDEETTRHQKFSKCVRYHADIFDIGARIDRYYTGCLFLHVLLSGALFGCIGYQITKEFSVGTFCLLSGWLLALYIVCISGQKLIDEALSITDIVYNSKWYERDPSFRKNLMFVIMRSQRPIVIHAGPFTYISHVILVTIFKTAYSYMTLLSATSV